MEKILLVIYARQPDMEAIDFACRLSAMTGSTLTGLFIENIFFQPMPADSLEGVSYFKTVRENSSHPVIADTEQAVRLFKEECQRKGINPEIYMDKGEPAEEVIFESRFADLLVLDAGTHFYENDEHVPSHFIKEILARAECPILLAPGLMEEEVDEIVFCYDGSASSVFAIKQFTYLLPLFAGKKALLLEVNSSGNITFDEGHRRMMEWLRSHYHSVYFHSLKGDVKDELFIYFFMKRKKIIVMGAYGRSMLSTLFRKSKADMLMETVNLPLFITHH